jgi:hypothetical protein
MTGFPDARLKAVDFLGIHGLIGDGKTSLYDAIKEEGIVCKDLSMAEPLKEAATILFGGTKEQYWGSQADRLAEMPFWKERLGEKWDNGRKQLQNLGDGFRQLISPWLWVYIAELRVIRGLGDGSIVPGSVMVIPDVRYDNEGEAVQMLSGITIRIQNMNRVVPPADVAAAKSEQGINPSLIKYHYKSHSREQTIEYGRELAALYQKRAEDRKLHATGAILPDPKLDRSQFIHHGEE